VDLLGQRRLGDPDPLGRLGEVPQLGYRDERTQLLELHTP
jgi:hypothetical protein